jgi:tetratricopeptide (TPR) repeat protein
MRRKERHHLKQNPLATLLAEAPTWLAKSGRPFLIGGGIALAAMIVVAANFSWMQLQERRAGEQLAEAMYTLGAAVIPPPEDPVIDLLTEPNVDETTVDDSLENETDNVNNETAPKLDGTTVKNQTPPLPVEFVQPSGSFPSLDAKLETALPQLLAVADSYPNTQQGFTSRYQAAAVLVALERANEAAVQYLQVMDLAGETLYGQMSRMGLAEALLLTGEPQEAIPLLEKQNSDLESLIPVDAVLMRLGYAYQITGQSDDAIAAFDRVVREFPISMYFTDAQQEVETLRQGDGTP